MALLFVYERGENTFSESFGLPKEEWLGLRRKLFDMIIEDIEMQHDDDAEDSSIIQSKLEYCQGLAEYLSRDLTPELGLLIGIVLAETEKMTEKIMNVNGMGREKQSE